MTNQQAEQKKQELIEKVVEQIKTDLQNGDVEAIEELLNFCPTIRLVGYLPEEDWEQFFELERFNS